jgi:hypothetical protein
VVEAAQGRGSRMVEKEAGGWDEERSENPEYALRKAGTAKCRFRCSSCWRVNGTKFPLILGLQCRMQRLLETV